MRIVGGKIEFKVAKMPPPFPDWVRAVTVWPFIFYEAEVWDDECVQIHERYHWTDQIRWLWVPWFTAYFILRPFYGGRDDHPLEKEAYGRQRACRDR